MNHIERLDAVINGLVPDRPPFSFWYHFAPGHAHGEAAIEAHSKHVETNDPDFLKIMDDNRYPRPATPDGLITEPSHLERLTVLNGDEGAFSRQLDLIRALARRYGGRLRMATTVFNAWTSLRNMTVPDPGGYGPPTAKAGPDPREATMSRLMREAPEALRSALDVIAESTANFVRHAIDAGADGIFLSVRDDWVDNTENGFGKYDQMVTPSDLQILASASKGVFNMLHVCGKAVDFARFAGYPAHVLSWADRYSGPSIADVVTWVSPTICAGLDNLTTMPKGTPADCAAEVADALRQAGNKPIIIAPGCTFDPDAVPAANLKAIRDAVELSRYARL